jgi:ABC-type spermidine/putrescine transport system permease subunit II
VAVLLFLLIPLFPPLAISVTDHGQLGEVSSGPETTLRWYFEMWEIDILVKSFQTSVLMAVVVGAVTTVIAVLAAMSVRELGIPRIVIMLMLLPLFVPGISMGLSTAFFFTVIGVPPSLLSIAIVHVTWALPFAFLIVLTVMATFDPVYLEAAYMSGANRWRAFVDIELPLIYPGVFGAAIFSMIISFNETTRTMMVQGGHNTIQTYIWSTFKQVGLTPALFALMGLLICLTFTLVLVLTLLGFSQTRRQSG